MKPGIARRMFRALAIALGALLLAGCSLQLWNGRGGDLPAPTGDLRVASFNVHYIRLGRQQGDWGVADWEARRGALDAAFKALDADIVAFQEMESFRRGDDGSVNLARDWLMHNNPAYALGAHGDWREFPATQPIFYRSDRLRLIDQGWFFFSETPDVIYSRTFDGSWPAFASWARFEDGQGRAFRVVNLHFEYRSASNRSRSAALVRDRLSPWTQAGERVILLGDLNTLRGWPSMDTIAEAGLRFPDVPGSTYHLNRGVNLLPAIDHIGLSSGIALQGGPHVLRRRYDGQWPSDHYPVVADLTLAPL